MSQEIVKDKSDSEINSIFYNILEGMLIGSSDSEFCNLFDSIDDSLIR